MKPSFHTRFVNSPFDDPCLYVRVLREGRALMFDLGYTAGLSARDMLKTTDIFVSHAHIDHFIGFDNILRTCLKRENPLRLYGPNGFIDRVKGKLASYTWNLIEEYPLTLNVFEIDKDSIKEATFRAENLFRPEDLKISPFQNMVMKESFYKVSATILDHQIPCLAFSLEEDYHINIDKDKLNRINLPVGPWLGELKEAIRGNLSDKFFTIDGKTLAFSELRGIANITKGQKITYVVDALGSEENKARIIHLAKGSDVLYIEAYFLDRDKEKATERHHLTAREAGIIAREADVGKIELIHFSPRYSDEPEALIREAEEEFRR